MGEIMTVGELREFLKPFTDECKVEVYSVEWGDRASIVTPTYRVENGEGFVVLEID
jgi:hypothetical protein